MAEQNSHNVVIQTQSTGGSAPLVDAASNLTTTAHASLGSKTSSNNDNRDSTSSTTLAISPPLADATPKAQAEPSAGIAVSEGANSATPVQAPEAEGDNTDASADPSVASDNEGSKQDVIDAAKDGGLHNRTNSVKRPTTFSRVAVTKNFLAKSATVAPVTSKIGEKAAAAPAVMAAPLALKPRLVAKSASSLSNTLRSRTGAEGSPGPEAGTVWNKNRAAPAVPAKQFTDEELKQQYGIHLATRLQTDENGKGAKWADIDDDEDDWAPEAVVWMDGTKSTLTPTEIAAAPSIIKPADPVKPTEVPKPSLTTIKRLGDSSSTIKTILKPGAAVQAKQQSDQAASLSQADKPALKAKSPAPVPVKSPWAALPPVDKVSPINPPVQVPSHHQPHFSSQDARVLDDLAPSSFGAREIAADTFDRSWREGEGERRELFNSTSGKYEPAPEGRRGSFKHEGLGRKPAVLSRVSQDSRVYGDNAFTHRRGSSVSHASGPSARRTSFGRGSDSVISDQPATNPQEQRPTPIGHTSPWASQLPPVPPVLPEGEDPIKVQERIMREKREAARQRRQEEEAREETAKQERLKAKLNALAGAGLSRKDRQQAAAEPPTATDKLESAPSADKSSAKVDNDAMSSGEQADLVASSVPESSPHVQPREHLSPSTASRTTFHSQNSGSYRAGTQQTSAFSSPGDRERKPQPFGRAAASAHPDSFAPWPTTSSSSNVWGVAGIGNGTFEGSSVFAPMPQHISTLPPPPGMGRPGTSSRVQDEAPLGEAIRASGAPSTQSRVQQGAGRQHAPGPIGPPSRSQLQQGSQRDSVSAWQSAAQRMPNEYNLDPEAEALKLSNSALGEPHRSDVFKETFRQTNGFRNGLGGARAYEKTEYAIHDAQGSRLVGTTSNPVPPNAQTQPAGIEHAAADAWKQGESAVRIPDGSLNPAHGGKALQQPPIAPPSMTAIPSNAVKKPFFTTAPLAPAPPISNVSPPPPETSSHPVFSGLSRQPHVRLPQPAAVVKLPPASAHMTQAMLMSQRQVQSWAPPGHGQPIVKDREWQARFNGLLGRASIQTETPPSPPRTPPKGYPPAIAVASSSRNVLDEAGLFGEATVSIPRVRKSAQPSLFKVDNSSASTSKQMVQHMFNDELGFGSRPRVRIPTGYKSMHESGSVLPKQQPAPVVSQSKPELPIFHLFYKRPGGIFVKLPGLHHNKFMRETFQSRGSLTKGGHKTKSALPSSKKEGSLASTKKAKTGGGDAAPAEKGAPSVAPPTSRKRSHKKHSPAPVAAQNSSA